MAYSDYGAYVYMNGEHREDKEDVALFEMPEETFGVPIEEVPLGTRLFMSLIHADKIGKKKRGSQVFIMELWVTEVFAFYVTNSIYRKCTN
jgi:hypothetical protein